MKNFIERFFSVIFLIVPLTWGGSFIAGKYVVQDIDPVASVVLRFFFSGLIMLPGLFLVHRHRHPNLLEGAFWGHLLLVVLTAGIGYHLFFFWALKYTSPTNTAIIIALNPFFTAFAEILFLKKRRAGRFYIGFIVAFAGALWVNLARGGRLDFANLGWGELFCLIAALFWSIYSITARLTKKQEWDSLWINAYNYLLTGLLLIPFAGQMFHGYFWTSVSGPAWLGMGYMIIFPTAISYTFFYIAVQRKGPAWPSTFIYLVPSVTANLDYLFFKAPLTSVMVLGTSLVVLGLLIGNIGKNQIEWLQSRVKSLILRIVGHRHNSS